MTTRAWFGWSLLFPLFVPLLTIPMLPLGDVGAMIGFFFLGSLFLAGGPYVLFAGGLVLWMRRLTPDRVVSLVWKTPWVFIPFHAACLILFAAGSKALRFFAGDGAEMPSLDQVRGLVAFEAMCAVFILVFGYLYVLLATGIWRLLCRWGHVRDEPPDGEGSSSRRRDAYRLARARRLDDPEQLGATTPCQRTSA
jgi:hypothetical protein